MGTASLAAGESRGSASLGPPVSMAAMLAVSRAGSWDRTPLARGCLGPLGLRPLASGCLGLLGPLGPRPPHPWLRGAPGAPGTAPPRPWLLGLNRALA